MKKIVKWSGTLRSDYDDFYLNINFDFGGSEEDYLLLLDHYRHLASMYRLEMALFHKWEKDDIDDSIYCYIRAHFRKTSASHLVSPRTLRSALENDLKILLRTFRIHEAELSDVPFE